MQTQRYTSVWHIRVIADRAWTIACQNSVSEHKSGSGSVAGPFSPIASTPELQPLQPHYQLTNAYFAYTRQRWSFFLLSPLLLRCEWKLHHPLPHVGHVCSDCLYCDWTLWFATFFHVSMELSWICSRTYKHLWCVANYIIDGHVCSLASLFMFRSHMQARSTPSPDDGLSSLW